MNEHLKELIKMINKTKRITNYQKKCESLYQLSAYASFIYYSGKITGKEFNDAMNNIGVDASEILYREQSHLSADNLILNNDLLHNFYNNNLLLYQKYQLEKEDILDVNYDIKPFFIDFLKYMHCYDLYCKLNDKKMISYNSPVLNYSVCIGNRRDSYIIIHEKDELYRYITLAHEIAHAYENSILNKRRQYFDVPYTAEIISLTFNRIFMSYLENNNILPSSVIRKIQNNFEVNCFDYVTWAYLITKAIKNDKYNIEEYDINFTINNKRVERSLTDHNYALGSVFSLSMYNMWQKNDLAFIRDLPNMIFFIDKMSLNELIDFFNKPDCISKELDKVLIKKNK